MDSVNNIKMNLTLNNISTAVRFYWIHKLFSMDDVHLKMSNWICKWVAQQMLKLSKKQGWNMQACLYVESIPIRLVCSHRNPWFLF